MKFNPDKFLEEYIPRFGKPPALREEGIRYLLEQINADPAWKVLRQVAYFLATIYWESGRSFQPVVERRARDVNSSLRRIQDRYWSTGFYGRGYVQITHSANYKKVGAMLEGLVWTTPQGLNGVIMKDTFTRKPELTLVPYIAYLIAARGCREGIFTGKKLSDYITDTKTDYKNARRVINGTDRALEVAGFAASYELILRRALEW